MKGFKPSTKPKSNAAKNRRSVESQKISQKSKEKFKTEKWH